MEEFLNKNILITGQTGSGKSFFLHNVITYLLNRNSPQDLKLVLIDPKKVELIIYRNLPHLLEEPIFDPPEAADVLKRAWDESIRRLNKIQQNKEGLPSIYIIVDEFSDLMMSDKREIFEEYFEKIASLSKITGVYIMLSSSRNPSFEDMLTRKIRESFLYRIAFKAAREEDSVAVIGEKGAEKLSKPGSCLMKNLAEPGVRKIQMPYIDDEKEVNKIKEKIGGDIN